MLKQYNVSRTFRGSGDCNRAKGHYTYGLRFESSSEAQKIALAIDKEFDLNKKPWVVLNKRKNKRLMGRCGFDGKITLFWKGMTVGCLLHELAHLDKRAVAEQNKSSYSYYRTRRQNRISHGSSFKFAQTQMILFYGKHLRDKFKVKKVDKDIRTVYGEKPVETFTWPVTTIIKPKPITKKVVKKVVEKPVELPPEEILELIEVAIEGIAKYAVEGKYITMAGLVRAMAVRGVRNKDEYRNHAIKHAKEIGLVVNTKY